RIAFRASRRSARSFASGDSSRSGILTPARSHSSRTTAMKSSPFGETPAPPLRFHRYWMGPPPPPPPAPPQSVVSALAHNAVPGAAALELARQFAPVMRLVRIDRLGVQAGVNLGVEEVDQVDLRGRGCENYHVGPPDEAGR